MYSESTQALNTRISLHRSNTEITENRKLNVSKYLHECSQGKFEFMPIYQINDYTRKKEKSFYINLSQRYIKHELHTNVNKYLYIYIYI